MVFVLNRNKTPLAPCHEAVARKLLKQGKAVVHRIYPFTIRLKEQKDTSMFKPNYRLKIDYGSRYTGIAIIKNDSEVIFMMQLHHRTDVKENMDRRRAFRRGRRNRKTRYREPRFLNRQRNESWLPPTLQSRVDNSETWVRRLCKLCPITAISYENVKFDTQLLRNPEISGIEYQQGTLQGYEVREYLLEKFDRKCVYCGATNVPLEIEHVIPKSRGEVLTNPSKEVVRKAVVRKVVSAGAMSFVVISTSDGEFDMLPAEAVTTKVEEGDVLTQRPNGLWDKDWDAIAERNKTLQKLVEEASQIVLSSKIKEEEK